MSLEPEKLKFFATFIESELGIVYSDSNYFQLEHRLNDISNQLGFQNVNDLWLKATFGIEGQFKALLLDLATNNETSFFRDASIFRGTIEMVVPELLEKKPNLKEVTIWSAACSSGQEPYSLAMAFEEARSKNFNFPDYRIFATDFSNRILARTQERTYSSLELQRGLPAHYISKYFEPGAHPDTWVINSRISPSKFEFQQLNLLKPWNFDHNFDIIFCRNVLIYQNIENKIAVISKMLKFLDAGGYLALGAAESLLGISDQFDQIHFENAVFYRKKQT